MTMLEALAALNVKVLPMEDCEKAELRICSEKRMFPESIEGKCADCGGLIFFDPGGPYRPKKNCLPCALGERAFSV